jgi:glutamate--cysteine ligase
VAAQQRIEAADSLPFEQYRLAYLAPERLQPRRAQAAAAPATA